MANRLSLRSPAIQRKRHDDTYKKDEVELVRPAEADRVAEADEAILDALNGTILLEVKTDGPDRLPLLPDDYEMVREVGRGGMGSSSSRGRSRWGSWWECKVLCDEASRRSGRSSVWRQLDFPAN